MPVQVHCQDSIVGQGFSGHTALAEGGHHGDQLGLAKGKAVDLVVLVEVSIEVVVVTELGLGAAVSVLGDTHSAYLRH